MPESRDPFKQRKIYGYLLMFTIKRRKSEDLQSVNKSKEKLHKFGARLIILILSSVLTWIPVLCVQILVLFQIPVLQDIYLWCVLTSFPVNLSIDPSLLINSRPMLR